VDGFALAAGLNLTRVSGVVRSENNSLTSSTMNGGTCAVRWDDPCECMRRPACRLASVGHRTFPTA
jgi:hypothetical protein